MAGIIQDEKELDRLLGLILANRLVFQSKEEFAEYAHFQALLSNNPISKMPSSDKVSLLARLKEDFLLPGTGYDSFDFFFDQYECVSEFFRNEIDRKKTLNTPDSAVKMALSLFHSHEKSGERKLDAVLEKLYDFELESRQRPYRDTDLLIMMMIGALPPMNLRSPKENPDFKEEWQRVKAYLHQTDGFRNMFESNPLLEELEKDIDEGRTSLNRLSLLDVVASFNGYLERAAHPKDIGKDFRYYELDGLWQNYKDGKVVGKNTYYQFLYIGQGYNLMEYEIFPSRVNKTAYHAEFQYEDKGMGLSIVHPKGGYETILGKPIGSNHVIWYAAETNDSIAPTRIKLERFKGGKGFSLFLDTLIKIPNEDAEDLLPVIESPDTKVVDVYAKYACVYPISFGVYAITKTHLYLIDPDHEGCYFKVPKEIDERLDSITVDSVAGALSVGEGECWWIGFEPIALYLSPEQCEACGVDRVDKID